MDSIEKEFKKIMLDNHIREPQFNVFKSSNPSIYKGILETLREVENGKIVNDRLTLLQTDITKLPLKEGQQKVFIFAGVYMFKGAKIVLLEKIETYGKHYIKDSHLVTMLKDYRVGLKIGIEKDNNKYNISYPQDRYKTGLFDKEEGSGL